MRDPMTLVLSIKNPIPKINLRRSSPADDARGWFHWQMRLFSKRPYISPFIYIGKYELYFDEIIGIWHTDPRGDVGPPCHGRKYWRWHIHHMSVKPTFYYAFIQRHITKCAWCGNQSNKDQGRVNHRTGNITCHAECLSTYIESLHSHDPSTCYRCKRLKEGN